MQLKIINSNSAGNAYILENDREALLIECGVRFDKIQQALGFNLNKVAGCILTHEHGDHAKSVADVMKKGINVHASLGTLQALGALGNHRAKVVQAHKMFEVRGFKIIPFDVKHDVAEPYGFVIYHPDCGKVLFLTDSYYCEYKFDDMSHIIIEANYCQKILDEKLQAGATIQSLRDRVIQSHMSLDTCKQTLGTYNLADVKNIVLIHLSDSNSHEERFKKEVEQQTGKLVHVARPGVTISFNKQPF